jgi:hypothetical protein
MIDCAMQKAEAEKLHTMIAPAISALLHYSWLFLRATIPPD